MVGINLKLIGNGWISLNITGGASGFKDILSYLQQNLPVMKYSKPLNRYTTSIYYVDHLLKIAGEKGWEINGSEQLVKVHKRYKRKLKEKNAQKENTAFESKFWTDDKTRQMLPYQATGVNFCLHGYSGGLIGDDLGCGKTAQAIGIICKIFEENENAKALVVVRKALRIQWRQEIYNFTKFDKDIVGLVGGKENYVCPLELIEEGKIDFRSKESLCKQCKNKEECKETLANGEKLRNYQINCGRIVIISYETMRLNLKELQRHEWSVVVFDEATEIKTRTALTSKAALSLLQGLPYTVPVVMSGTFIENSIDEMYVPVSLIDGRVLGTYYNFSQNYLVKNYFKAVIGFKNIEEFKKRIKPFLIRRTLDEVWHDRPELVETNRSCELSKFQRKIYDDAKNGVLKELENLEFSQKINFAGILSLINYLMQLACTVETLEKPKKNESASSKIDELCKIVNEEIGHRKGVLVFCSFPYKVGPYVVKALEKTGNKVGVIHGNLKSKEINEIIERFKRKELNVLLSSDVLAYGINLQCANYVINLNLPWNPAVVLQRIARVYRKGQKVKRVVAINLIAENTIDDHILQKLSEKNALFDQVLRHGEFRNLKKPDIKELLNIINAEIKN